MVLVENRGSHDAGFVAGLRPILECQESIRTALDWLAAQTPPLTISEMVAQDEFSHDLLVDFGNGNWLVYDSS